jgi:superfamily I DNA/RNA helicase
VRVAGTFTVESLSPHRVAPPDEEELIDLVDVEPAMRRRLHKVTPPTDFAAMVLEHLRSAGVHQTEKRDALHGSGEAELEDVYETERRLLYVAATRARDRLLVTGVKPGSEFLRDMAV